MNSRRLEVSDSRGVIGTLELHEDGECIADPEGLISLVEPFFAAGKTAEQAFTELAGWSNGYVTVREVPVVD